MSNIGNKETFAKNLAYYVDRSGKSQKQISEELNFSRTIFNEWLKAKKYPRIDKIEILADYFGILKSDLIEERSEEHREMQKKTGTIADAVIKMKNEPEFLSLVETLMKLDEGKIRSVQQMLTAFFE